MANLDILMGVSSAHTIMDVLENDLSIWDIIEKMMMDYLILLEAQVLQISLILIL